MIRYTISQLLPKRNFSTVARTRPFQVAIDGPAASGKSTTAKLVAQRLGFNYIDTGAFYRCITLAVLSKGIDPSDPANAVEICKIADQAKIKLQTVFTAQSNNSSDLHHQTPLPTTKVFLDTKDVTLDIRTGQVSKHVSVVAALGDVRESVLQKVRSIGATEDDTHNQHLSLKYSNEGLVMDGRDIGTVVLPHADLKIFLIADSRVRAERRLKELIKNSPDHKVEDIDIESVQKDLEMRDELDRTRKVSPLKKADDAIELDTSNLTTEDQVDAIVDEIERRRKPLSP